MMKMKWKFTMQKFKKILKDVKWSSIILLVLVLILFFINIAAGTLSGLSTMSIILQIVLLLGTIVGCNNEMLYGPICGTVVAILMILSFTIVTVIIGVAYLLECISLIKYMQN